MDRTSKIKVGIIGLGAIGTRLLKDFIAHENTEITAVCDVFAERAKQVAEENHINEWYTDYKKLIAESDTDLIYVAVPPSFHYEVVKEVIQASKHILCEKPLANSVEEAREMWELVQNSSIVHAMNFPLIYSVGALMFKKQVNEGYIGKLRKVELQMNFPQWPRVWQQNQWVASREQGGFTLEVGIHFIQLIQRIFGALSNIHRTIEWPVDISKSEIGIVATMMLPDKTPVLFNGISEIAGEERISLTAYGTSGTLSLVNWGTLEGGKLGESIRTIPLASIQSSSLITNLVERIRGNTEHTTIVDFEEGYKAQIILENLRKG